MNIHCVRVMQRCALLVLLLATARFTSAADESMMTRPADTSSPRATLKSFIDSINAVYEIVTQEKYFDRTSTEHLPDSLRVFDCMDISKLPEFERAEAAGEIAVALKEVLDRVELPPYEEIPDAEAIEASGDPKAFYRWKIPGTRIVITRIEEGPQQHEYLISSGTIERARSYYNDMKSLPYRTDGPRVTPGFYDWYLTTPGHPAVAVFVDWLPDWTRQRWLGISVWKLIGLVILLPGTLALMGLCYKLQMALGRRTRETSIWWFCLTIIFPIVATLLPFLFVRVTSNILTVRGQWLYVLSFATSLLAMLASFVVVFSASNRIAALIINSPRINPQGLDAQFIRIVTKILSIVVVVIIFLEGGNYLGIPVTTLIASAGVGGLAVALAAQDMLKNLFGTIMLLTDKPFRVGERIIFGKYDGVVRDIGLRSTRLQLLTGHEATIPNDELARNDIENVGRRPHIRRVANIHIPLDTPQEKVQRAVEIVRTVLQDHEGMAPDYPPRVFFLDFSDDAFVIRAMYWYTPANYWDFVNFGERFNFQIFEEFSREGIRFTLPTRVTHTSIDSQPAPIDVRISPGQEGDRSDHEE